uniref:Ankyrin repeat domain 24 n=1 Tax=Pelodiscus sinensis TaxID=13735 RepID=K7FU82_PELSI
QSQDWGKNDEKLLQAVDYNDPEKVSSLLLRKGLVPTKLDSEGKSAFHLAAMRGTVDCLEVMLAHGADPLVTDRSGYNALHLAAKHGHPQCVSKLLQASCPVDGADSNGRTALHYAAVSGCISCSEILCDFKASLNAKDKDGCTPLILAAKMRHSELCRYLLHRGAAVNSRDLQGRTALMLACEIGSAETVEILVHAGARVGMVDARGQDAAGYSLATGNALIQHYLQDASQRHSLASAPTEEESAERTSQTSSPSQPLLTERNSSPRKRKAPPPPPGTASQEDREAYEEIVRLRQERARFLHKIKGLEHQQEKQKREAPLHVVPSPVCLLTHTLLEGREWLRGAVALGRSLTPCLRVPQTEKENTSYDIDTLQDEEGDLLEFPGAELLLSKKTLSLSAEELVATLQGQVQSLTLQNKELLEKIQILENYEKDESDMVLSEELVPVALYDSLRSEFQRLQGQHAEAQAALGALEGNGPHRASCELVPVEAYEQLKAGYEARIQALEEALHRSRGPAEPEGRGQELGWAGVEAGGSSGEGGAGDAAVEELASVLAETREKYEAAVAEVQLLREQMQLGILSVEEPVGESAGSELEMARAALQEAQAALLERDQRLKDLEGRLEAQEEASSGGCCAEEMKASLTFTLEAATEERAALLARCSQAEAGAEEAATEERAALLARCSQAEAGAEELRRNLEERAGELQEPAVGGGEPAAPGAAGGAERAVRGGAGPAPAAPHGSRPEAEAGAEELRRNLEERAGELQQAMSRLAESQQWEEESRQLREQLEELSGQYEEARARLRQLHMDHGQKEVELNALKEQLASESLSRQEQEELAGKLSGALAEASKKLLELEEQHGAARREVAELQQAAERHRRESVPLAEHARAKEALEARARRLEQELAAKAQEASQLQGELASMREGTVPREEHEQLRSSLQAEVTALSLKLSDLGRKHEKTCTEVFQVQREALFMKSEKQAAEAQLAATEKQLQSLRAESERIQELHGRIEDSANLVKEKDRKITELSKEIFRLKEALTSLSVLSGQGGTPPQAAPQNPQEVAKLQSTIKALEQQLAETEKHHRKVVSLYRSHLLCAIQGHMDEDVQRLLYQILMMQRLQEQGR